MNIGIISNKAHVKRHSAALRTLGHDVTLLGGSPSFPLPTRLEVVVCRPASVSHGGFRTAMRAKRENSDVHVIIADGIKAIVDAVGSLVAGEPQADELVIHNSADAMRILSTLLGVYGSPLHHASAGPVVEALAAARGEDGARGFELWKQALVVCKQATVRSRARAEALRGVDGSTWVYSYPPRGNVGKIGLFVSDAAALEVVLTQMDLAGTHAEAVRQRRKKRIPAADRRERKREADRLRRARKKELLGVVVDSPQPVVPEPVVPEPVVFEPGVPELVVSDDWDAQLRSAISLVLSEMISARVNTLKISRSGSVTYTRVVVSEGSMQVQADGAD